MNKTIHECALLINRVSGVTNLCEIKNKCCIEQISLNFVILPIKILETKHTYTQRYNIIINQTNLSEITIMHGIFRLVMN